MVSRMAWGTKNEPDAPTETAEPASQQGGVIFDRQDQLDKIKAVLVPDEKLMAVYDGKGAGTGFIGLTDRRVIIQDNSFVGGKIALTSVPYSRVNAVSFVSDKSMFGKFASSSVVSISAGGTDYVVEFRGVEKAQHAHDVVLSGLLSDTSCS
jgi:hypothetical protein